MLFSDNQFTVS